MAVAGDDDATPEVAFNNVPRPRKEEELGGDDDPGRGGSSAPPSPPSRDGDDGPDVRRAEKRRRLVPAEDAKNGGAPPPAAAAASEWAEKERIRKGKMPAAAVDASMAGSGDGKLIDDAIRRHGGSKNKKKKPKPKKRKDLGLGPPFWYGMGRDGQSTSTAGSGVDHSFDNLPPAVVSAGLRAALPPGGAAPVRVYGRLMSGCDRNTHQSRLQMSCKSWRAHEDGEYPVCAFLTGAERAAAHGEGLVLKAYDRRGREYDLKLRYLACNSSYRLISKWGDLLRKNGLVVDKGAGGVAEPVMLELWLFRPPGGGAVGMVVLHYYKGDAKHADAALEEEEDRRRATKSRRLADDAYSTAAKAGGAPSEVAEAPLFPDADGTKAEQKEAGRAPVEAAAPSSSEASGGAAKVVAPGEADGTKTVEEKDANAAPPIMEAAAVQSASPSGAGGAAKAVGKEAGAPREEAAPPPPPADDAGGAKKAASRFGLTLYEWWAAHALLQLSRS